MVKELLTKRCSVTLRQDIHKFISSELANGKTSSERIIFIYFCQNIASSISKKYFAESFLETYVSLLAVERNQSVIFAMIKTAEDLRPLLEEASHISKLEGLLTTWKADKKKCRYIQEVYNNIINFL